MKKLFGKDTDGPFSFPNERWMKNHMANEHRMKAVKEGGLLKDMDRIQSTRKPPNFYKKVPKVGIKQVSFKCADCSEISHNKNDLVEHMKNVHGKTIKFVSNQTIKKNLGVHNSATGNSDRQILNTKTLKVVGPPVSKVGKLKASLI